jgi:histone H3
LRRLALKDIRKQQARVTCHLPFTPTARLVRDIANNYMTGLRFTKQSLEVLRRASETYLTELFEDSGAHMRHAKRATLMPRDIAHCYNTQRPIDHKWTWLAVGTQTVAFTGQGGYYSLDNGRESNAATQAFIPSLANCQYGADRGARLAWNDHLGSQPLQRGTNVLRARAAGSMSATDPVLGAEDMQATMDGVAAHGPRDPADLVDTREVAARAQRDQMGARSAPRPTVGAKTPRSHPVVRSHPTPRAASASQTLVSLAGSSTAAPDVSDDDDASDTTDTQDSDDDDAPAVTGASNNGAAASC